MSGFDAALAVVFWVALAGVLQTYVGLPLVLKFLCCFWRRHENYRFSAASDEDLPLAAVIIPAHNEEVCIRQRIENLLTQDYPADKLRIVVGSDCSTDHTHEIVRGFDDPRVELRIMPDRRGKLGVIDTLTPDAPGEVVVVTDANVHFERAALRILVSPFVDARVGGVSGDQRYVAPRDGKLMDRELIYRKFETKIKIILGLKGTLFGAYGGFYAFRKVLFRPFGLKPVHDDIILPLEVLAQGSRFVFAPEAVALENTCLTAREEYRRRVRMTGYSLRSIGRAMRLAKRAGMAPFLLFFSYKVLRWLSPYLNVVGVASAAALALRGASPVYTGAVALAGLWMAAALAGWLTRSGRRPLPVAASAYYFALMNLAAWEGAFKLAWVKRHWEPRGG